MIRRILQSLTRRAKRAATLSRLRKVLKDNQSFVDYGWIKLAFSDDGDEQEIIYHQHCDEYRNADLVVFEKYIKPGDIVVDVGANMGFVTTLLSQTVGATGKVYSFEPLPTTYAKLLRTIELNKLENVSPINRAASDQESVQTMYQVHGSSGGNSLQPADSTRPALGEVHLTTLDAYFRDKPERIAFLKIDTEGHESLALKGGAEMIQKNQPVILIELCQNYRESSLASIQILKEYGYRFPIEPDVDGSFNGDNFVALPASR